MSEAAREAKPDIAILLYGIHPLHLAHADILAMDDMGDHGRPEAEGHRHWSVWAALAAGTGRAVNGSSGYFWSDDVEILLDSAVLGQAGAVLPLLAASDEATPRRLAVRRALNRWCRRTVQWRPLWLDSDLGSLDTPPRVRSWAASKTTASPPCACATRAAGPTDTTTVDGGRSSPRATRTCTAVPSP
ncbi:hypothetical protein Pflav_028980 [Phytohabitans flavus]|uniref:Uncharacterized protein n=1 Tax=Phytohabitans flavus TaxID=1076124 RepID=A0A6F8XRW1_9ACTN|nr:hypothetical protein [Phytohabitans flavus]BCB76488.1 hypothetical protein Pflav_028980 [Phytohabitans flavus]